MLALARQDFPELKVSTFTRSTLYPDVDTDIREGKVSNVLTSQLLISLLCGVSMYWRNRKLTTQSLCPFRGGVGMALPLFFATIVMGLAERVLTSHYFFYDLTWLLILMTFAINFLLAP